MFVVQELFYLYNFIVCLLVGSFVRSFARLFVCWLAGWPAGQRAGGQAGGLVGWLVVPGCLPPGRLVRAFILPPKVSFVFFWGT